MLLVAATVTWAAFAGCDKVEGLFGDGGFDAGVDAGLPVEYLPGRGTLLDRAACAECMRTECSPEIAACMDDAACAIARACTREALDPAAFMNCETDLNAATEGEQRLANLVTFRGLRTCEKVHCSNWPGEVCEAAPLGDVDCHGAYDWPDAWTQGGRTVSFSIWLADPASKPIPDLSVKLCFYVDQKCTSPVDQQITDEDGLAKLSYTPPLGSSERHYLEIRANPALEDEPEDIRLLYFPESPDFVDGVSYWFVTATWSEAQELFHVPVPAADSDRGAIMVVPLNCLRDFTAGLTLADSIGDASSPIAYGFPIDETLTATPASAYSLAWVLNASAGVDHELTLTTEDTGMVVSHREVFVRPGWISVAVTTPLTATQQAELEP